MLKLQLSAMLTATLGMALVVSCAVAVAQTAGTAKPAGTCKATVGRGVAPTEQLARLQAWERVAQATGNWPFVTDTFKTPAYRCAKSGETWRCQTSIVVCRTR